MKLNPYEKGRGGWKGLAMLKGGRNILGVVFPRKLDIFAILKRERLKKLLRFESGDVNRGGGHAKSFGPAILPVCRSPRN